jgi:ATP-dependent DNA helicase RecG
MTQQPSLFEVLTLHRFDITQMLSGLVEKGMLVPHGRSRGAYYTLPLPAPTDLKVEASSLHSDTSSPHSNTMSPHSEASSPHKGASSPHSEESFPHNDTAEDVQTWEELQQIAAPVAKGRATSSSDTADTQ